MPGLLHLSGGYVPDRPRTRQGGRSPGEQRNTHTASGRAKSEDQRRQRAGRPHDGARESATKQARKEGRETTDSTGGSQRSKRDSSRRYNAEQCSNVDLHYVLDRACPRTQRASLVMFYLGAVLGLGSGTGSASATWLLRKMALCPALLPHRRHLPALLGLSPQAGQVILFAGTSSLSLTGREDERKGKESVVSLCQGEVNSVRACFEAVAVFTLHQVAWKRHFGEQILRDDSFPAHFSREHNATGQQDYMYPPTPMLLRHRPYILLTHAHPSC